IELPKILEEAQKSIFDLTQSQSDERPELLHISVGMQEMYSDMEKKLSGEVVPIQSGFYDLDDLTGGFEPNQFIVIGGRPAMGKTAIGVDIAWNIASKQNNQHKPVFFFSLEMDRRQLARRLTTRLSGVEGSRLKTPKFMTNDNWIQVSMAMETSEESKLYICDHS
ncbi:MAG: DnaB-like helicase C-terminal domain-containing protein, partial [Dolichospermum sp.]